MSFYDGTLKLIHLSFSQKKKITSVTSSGELMVEHSFSVNIILETGTLKVTLLRPWPLTAILWDWICMLCLLGGKKVARCVISQLDVCSSNDRGCTGTTEIKRIGKRRGILLCTCRSVGGSVCMSVSLNFVQLITQECFTQEASNLLGR